MVNNLIVCGGTFDHFHKGHRSLLKLAFSLGQHIVVGVTSDQYVRSSKLEAGSLQRIESFEERKEAVLEFVKKEGVLDKTEIVEISDLFGPTLDKNFPIDVIVVSEDTKKGADIINQERKELNLIPLKIIVVPLLKAEDKKNISSSRIRKGEIDREGKLYVNPLWLKRDLMLPENLREKFKKPFGVLMPEAKGLGDLAEVVATVGDITTKKFNEFKLNQQVSVIDFKVERQKRFSDIRELGFLGNERLIKVSNPAGSITSDLFKVCLAIWNKGKVILSVEGEEDLAVLPMVLTAPLQAAIYYGQPNEGLVKIEVSEEIKKIVYGLVNRFEMQY